MTLSCIPKQAQCPPLLAPPGIRRPRRQGCSEGQTDDISLATVFAQPGRTSSEFEEEEEKGKQLVESSKTRTLLWAAVIGKCGICLDRAGPPAKD